VLSVNGPRTASTAIATAAVIIGALCLLLVSAGGTRAAAPSVYVFPVPGDPVASPATQITFRGIPISQLGQITVTGSRSGVHTGTVEADSDSAGGSFLPAKPFTAGERVTVKTAQAIVGGRSGTYSFTVATPAGRIPASANAKAPRVKGDVWQFVSNPGLQPAAVKVTKLPSHAAAGDLFVAPQDGPVQYGPEILGPYGGLIWFHPLPKNDSATDFRVQSYAGKPVLTWWQGNVSAAGTGNGYDEIYNTSYQQVATVHAGNGLTADLHEFQITPQGTALMTAFYPVIWNATSIKGGGRRQIVLDSVVQEVDIKTGLVLFQWDSLDQVPVDYSYSPIPATGHPFDYFHINSIQQDPDGSLIVSSRATWAVYDISSQTGKVIWRLNGKHSSFKMGPGTRFAFQHDARLQPNGQMTIFDDGAGPPVVESQSRALTLRLDTKKMTATWAHQNKHRPALLAAYEGNVQDLGNYDQMVGWGQQPYLTEFNNHGVTVFDARFVGENSSYRAYRFPWNGTPTAPPDLAVRTKGSAITAYVSWNGATATAKWRILSGSSATALTTVTTAGKQAFESAISVPAGAHYVAAQALNAAGQVLATSKTVAVP
jgi:hypothetical protein